MHSALLVALLAVGVAGAQSPKYEETILKARAAQNERLKAPDGWLALVALVPLKGGDVSVGSAADNKVRLEHGAAHAFSLHVEGGKVHVTAADGSVTWHGKSLRAGEVLPASDDMKDALRWSTVFATVIERTGNETFLRVGDANSPNLRAAHPLNFYPVDRAFRVEAKWVPYTTPHEMRMGTTVGSVLVTNADGYAEFVRDGQTVHLDGAGGDGGVTFSFRDGTSATTTYGGGRWVRSEVPSHGVKAVGTMVIDFNRAQNWPCAYTAYGTCPLPPKENRFEVGIAAGEKRYHE